MTKRLIAFLLVLTFIFTVAPVGVFATFVNTANITVVDAFGMAGETVEVYVIIKDNPGVTGATLTISYDEALTLTDAVAGEALSSLAFSKPGSYASPCNFVWDAEAASDESTENGVVMKLLFKVDDAVEAYTNMNVTVSYSFGDVYNNQGDVSLDINNGYVTAIEYVPGDVNGDDRVTTRDTQLIRQLIAGGYESAWADAGITVNSLAADVNDDGRVNSKDTQLIRQVVAGGYTDEYGVPIILRPVTPECKHTLTAFEATDATCTEDGNIAYWYCENCNSYFSDAEGLYEISESETVKLELGHTVVVDEAVAPTYSQTGLTEGSHCSVCGVVLMEQEIIPALSATYHAIIYRNLQGAESPEITRFAEHEGIVFEDVPSPVRVGYTFLGWYTASEGGTKVDMIEAGTSKDITVFAHWGIETYTITCKFYNDAPLNHSTVIEYTIEGEVTIPDPELNGLNFAYWTVKSGNIKQETVGGRVVYKVPKGSHENIELVATWRYRENLAVPNYTGDYTVYYDPETKTHSFVYQLGTIENVVVKIHASGDITGINSLGWDQTWVTAFDESSSKEIGKTISNSVTKTEEWQTTKEWANSHSTTDEDKFTLKVGGEFFLKAEAGGEWTDSETDTNSYSFAEFGGGSTGNTSGEEQSVSSTVAFSNSYSHSLTEKIDIPITSPKGTYRYVSVGTVCVYAVLTYDFETKEYFINTFSVLKEDVRNTVLYTPLAESYINANIIENEGLPFSIPTSENGNVGDIIEEAVANFYYVKFDANQGTGKMPIVAYAPGVECKLPANEYARDGYVFNGWASEKNSSTATNSDGASIKDLANSKETITLYAVWLPILYKATWNQGVNYTVTVKRTQSNEGTPGELSSDATVYYGDVLEVTYTAKTGYTVDKSIDTIYVGTEDLGPEKFITTATPVSYVVVYDFNNGTGDRTQSIHTFDAPSNTIYGELSREGYVFLGWSQNSNATASQFTAGQDVKNQCYDIRTLYAVWLRTYYSGGFNESTRGWKPYVGDGDKEAGPYYESIYTGLNPQALIASNRFTQVKMRISFVVNEENDGYQILRVRSAGNMLFEKRDIESCEGWGVSSTVHAFEFTFALNQMDPNGVIDLEWNAHGTGEDDWYLGDTHFQFWVQ